MARLRDRLIAHGDLIDQLLPTLQGEGMAVTFLFAGPAGVGKKLAARALAQALLCERRSDGCGQCGSCLRLEHDQHESFLHIKPDGTQIKIDQAREIVDFLHLSKIGRARVILIEDAQAMNIQAANALLKVLEEPPEGTFIILLAPSPSALLPTLRSRSRAVLFRPLSESELKRVQTAPDWAVKAARGSVERLQDLMNPEEQEVRTAAARALEELLENPQFVLSGAWRDLVKEKGRFPRVLGYWLAFARDGLVLHAKSPAALMNPDLKGLLTLLQKEPHEQLEFLIERCLRLDAETTFNRDPQLAVEQLWVALRERRESLSPSTAR